MSQSPTKQLDAAGGAAEDDYGEWSIDLKSNAFEGAMKEISSGFELERAAFEREFLTKFRELRRPITKEIIDTVNSGRAAIEVVNEFFDKAIVEVMGFMHGRRELEDALQGKLMHATHHVFETGVDAMLRRDREKKAFLKQSYETRIEESRISSKVEQSNSTLVLEAKYERQIFELKERLVREADAMAAALRSKDEDIRVAHAQFNSKLAAEKAGAKHYAEQLKTDLESAKSQLELLRKSTASSSSAKSVLESERKALSDEMARLVTLHKEERHRNEVQMHKLRTELDDVKASQAAERKKIKDTTEQASKQLEAAHDQLRSMQFELQSMQQSVDVSNVRLAESEGSLKDLYGRYRESQSILSETLSSKEDHEKAALIAQDAIIELTREKEELLIMLQDCKAQMAVGEAKLAELQAELEAVLKAQERNRKKLLESEMKVTMLNTDVSAARSRLTELEDEVAALKEEIESLRIARDAAANSSSSKSSTLAQQLHDLQQEFDDARAVREVDKQGSEEVIAALRSRIAELESRPVSQPPQPHGVVVPLVARSAEDTAAHEHGKQDAAVVRAATPPAAAAHNVDTHTEPTTQHVRAAAAAVSPQSSQDAVSLGERPRPAPAPALPDATGRASHSATRMSIKSAEASDSDSARLTSADSDQSKPDSRDSNPFSAASAQSSMRAPSVALSHLSSLADDAPQTRGNYSASDTRASKEGQRMTTASIVSTSSGLSVSGMSGVQAAAVFMNDAGRTVLVDSASEAKFPPNSNAAASTDPALFNALNLVLSEYGFDNESSAFISTCLLQQQSAFTLKMAQQRQAFDACIESFKCSAAAQMELQLVQLSKAHESESIQTAKALNDNKRIVLELKKKNAELHARISQMETQALQPRGADSGAGSIGEVQARLEAAGMQMQAYLNVIEEQRAQISVFLNALKSVGGASDGEIDLFRGSSKATSSVKELKLVLPNAAKTSGQQNTKNMHATYTVLKRSKSTTPSGFDSRADVAAGMLPSIRQ